MNAKPSVLYVAPDIPVPHAGVFLGGSTHVMEVSKILIKSGFTVYVLCRRMSRDQPAYEKLRDDFHVYRAYRGIFIPILGGVSQKSAAKPSVKLRLSKLAEKIYFATVYRAAMALMAVHIMYKHKIGAVLERNSAKGIGAFSAKALGRPLVEEVIDPDFSVMAVRMADSVFAYTPKVLQGIVPAEKIAITTAGVDTETFRPVDGSNVSKKYRLEGKKVIVYVGEMSSWHGIDVLVKAAQYLGEDYRILILGKNAEVTRPLATELGVLDKLVFTGPVEHRDVPQYISAADVGVAPYDPSGVKDMERFGFYFSPIKMFEYMACGKPLVASDIDIVRDIVNDSGCGLLVKPGDPEALAAAIRSLIEAPDRSASMGSAGRRACLEKYNWDSVGSGISGAIERLIDQTG